MCHSPQWLETMKRTAEMSEEELKEVSSKYDGVYFHKVWYTRAIFIINGIRNICIPHKSYEHSEQFPIIYNTHLLILRRNLCILSRSCILFAHVLGRCQGLKYNSFNFQTTFECSMLALGSTIELVDKVCDRDVSMQLSMINLIWLIKDSLSIMFLLYICKFW